MPLNSGFRLGPYEILAPLGAGGMGIVHRARDTNLDRDVAVKVLPETVARDPERLARFEREAKALATLNHPNIAQIHGLEQSGDLRAIVMELVPGETLSEIIRRGPISERLVLDYAAQMVSALDAAHTKSIVHRDFKPGNVMATPEGQIKVLDFGLVGRAPAAESGAKADDSPTLTNATRAGVIIGTAAYMAPEQASGQAVDKRADIWSFGVVLWELLTGKRLFEGETVSHVLAAVLTKDPDLSAIPDRVRPLLKRCLEKDPKKRLRDIGDAMSLVPAEAAQEAAKPGLARFAPWALAILAVLTATLGIPAFLYFRSPAPEPPRVTQFQIPRAEGMGQIFALSLSPDGRTLAIRAPGSGPGSGVWLHSFDSLETRLLPGTERAGGTLPWSPDGRFFLIGSEGRFKKVSATGGPSETFADIVGQTNFRGGFWAADGRFVFFSSGGTGASAVYAVPAEGGNPEPISFHQLPGWNSLTAPQLLPDGKHLLFFANGTQEETTGTFVTSLNDTSIAPRRLLSDFSTAVYVPAKANAQQGHLVFQREEVLVAQRFDASRLELTGDAVPIGGSVQFNGNTSLTILSASAGGTLAYLPGSSRTRRLTWFDRQGNVLSEAGRPAAWQTVSLTPGGKVLASQGSDQPSLWTIDGTAPPARLTTLPALEFDGVWSPKSDAIALVRRLDGSQALYWKSLLDAGKEELLFESPLVKYTQDWSPDGRFLIFQQQDPKTKRDLWLLPLEGERKARILLQTAFNESEAQFSPDMRWIAYQSDDSGRYEVYVKAFDQRTGELEPARVLISSGGGHQVRWRPDGKELFYLTPTGTLMAADVMPGAAFKAGTPNELFTPRVFIPNTQDIWRYDVTPNGQRFLINTVPDVNSDFVNVILNWQGLLK